MNTQVISHWKLAWRTLKTAVQVTLSVPYRMHKAALFQMHTADKIERQREAFAVLPPDNLQRHARKSPAVLYIEFLDRQLQNTFTQREKEIIALTQTKYLQIFGLSKNDLDNGYFNTTRM